MSERKRARPASGNYRYETRGINTRFRWMSYEHSDPPIDYEGRLFEALELNMGNEIVADVGSGPPFRLLDLYIRGHRGRNIAIDPFPEQMDLLDVMESDLPEYEGFMESLDFLQGRFQSLPIADKSIDRVLAEQSMYLVPKGEQGKALEEIKRVLKDEGLFVLTTSGPLNKSEQRKEEKLIAEVLGAKAPRLMNSNYNSQRAQSHLRFHFASVDNIPLHGYIVYHNREELEAKYFSLLSMKDQFDPIPHSEEYHKAIMRIFEENIYPKLERDGVVTDIYQRDIFVCRFPISGE